MLLTVDYPGDIDLLRFNAAGTRLALAQDWRQEEGGEVLLVVEVPSGKEVARYAGLHGVQDMLFRSEEEVIVFHGFECWLCGPKKKPRRLIREQDLKDHPGPVNTGALSPDGQKLAAGASEALILVDMPGERIESQLSTPTAGYVGATVFSPDGRYLAFATSPSDYTYISYVVVWDRRRKRAVRLLKLDSESVDALAFRPDNRWLAVVMGHRGSVSIYDLDPKPRAGRRRREYLDELSPRTFSSQRNLLYGMSWSEPVALHSAGAGEIQSLRFSADGRILKVVCYGGAAVRLYARSGRVLSHSRPPDGYTIQATAVSERGLAAGTVEDSRSLLLWDVPRWSET